MTEACSFDLTTVFSTFQTNGEAAGGGSVTMSGINFGANRYSCEFRIGRTAAVATDWASDTLVTCKRTGDAMRSLKIKLTAGVSVRSGSEAVSEKLLG